MTNNRRRKIVNQCKINIQLRYNQARMYEDAEEAVEKTRMEVEKLYFNDKINYNELQELKQFNVTLFNDVKYELKKRRDEIIAAGRKYFTDRINNSKSY